MEFGSFGQAALAELERRYFVSASEMVPALYYRLTDNWLELTVRFIAPTHAIRELKDAMSREILARFDDAGLRVASATLEIVRYRTASGRRKR